MSNPHVIVQRLRLLPQSDAVLDAIDVIIDLTHELSATETARWKGTVSIEQLAAELDAAKAEIAMLKTRLLGRKKDG